MHFYSRNLLKKAQSGAVLMQVLLGLAIMVAMTPVIMNQIRQYNESINREEVITQMTLLQKAVTSYISFDRTDIPDGCVVKTGNEMINLLQDYGGEKIATSNKFGQVYSFITCKKQIGTVDEPADIIEAAVFAYGDVDDITLNSIGEYLFDQGVVLSTIDHTELTNYKAKLSPTLKTEISKIIGNQGALVMFVSDGFAVSDYLYINKGPGDSVVVNTMLANLDINNNNLIDVFNANGTVINILSSMKVAGLAGKNLSIADSVLDGVFSIENTAPFPDAKMQIKPKTVNINSLKVQDAEFSNIELDPGDLEAENLETNELVVEGELNVVSSSGNVDSGWSFGASDVVAESLDSNGPVANKFNTINLKDNEGIETYIYDGTMYSYGDFDPSSSSKLNLSGVSEVVDICWAGGNCISTQLQNIYNKLLELWALYTNNAGGTND